FEVALRPAPHAPRTRSSLELRAPTWAAQQVQLAMSCRVRVLAQWCEFLSHRGCQGAGRPERWLVTITGELFSSVASATNSSATSTKPTAARKARAGIAAFRLHASAPPCMTTHIR